MSEASPPILTLREIEHDFGDGPLFDGTEVYVRQGDRICLVGRNGSGKSTLLRIAAGLLVPDAGERFVQPGARVTYVGQEPTVEPGRRVRDVVATGLRPEDAAELHRVDALLDALRLDGDRLTDGMSGGEQRRVVLAQAMVGHPEVLLLDEPTNHLDLPAIEWLEAALARFDGALVLISHDRRFLTALTRRTFWLDRGVVRVNAAGFSEFEAWAEVVEEAEVKAVGKLDQHIARETRWLRRGVTARRKRNLGRLERLNQLRSQRASVKRRLGDAKLKLDQGDASGHVVLEARGISKRYGDLVVLDDLWMRVMRGDRIGVVGPNGAGKSTLLRILTEEIAPDSGSVRYGTRLTPVYLDQHRALLDPGMTVKETLCESGGDYVWVHGEKRHVVGYLEDFLFDRRQATSRVCDLSGGERNRLVLAKTLSQPSNLLILDEPTNDLDMETLDLLQELLADYAGTLLLVSHDRDFLDRVVTSTLAFEGDGAVVEYAGGYSDVVTQRALAEQSRAAVAETTIAEATAADVLIDQEAEAASRRPREKKRLSYKEERELEALAAQVATLEAEIGSLERLLADPEAYARDREAFEQATRRVGDARGELATAEERWLELEVLREELGG